MAQRRSSFSLSSCQRVGHEGEHGERHRVLALRAVHRDDHHVTVAFHLDLGHRCSFSARPRPRRATRHEQYGPRGVGSHEEGATWRSSIPGSRFARSRSASRPRPIPFLRRNLETLLAHMKAEMAGDVDGLLVTLCDDVHYHAYGAPRSAQQPGRAATACARSTSGSSRRAPVGCSSTSTGSSSTATASSPRA